ncbi:hypothetical protein PRZ48_008358 [Zasmidium cellare]|uniref:Uncharacterized protein n=1 Tax=Zasmidium cellare TaxID=395010 RepID=A0ABR0EFB1_ZASCE|nr:hypothetical protein PRZ48_008358 [Zasmidium cellare]
MSKQPQYAPDASHYPQQYVQASGSQPQPTPPGYDFQHVKILEDSIRIGPTNQLLWGITRPDGGFHFSSSEKPPIQIGNSQTGLLLGTIRTHKATQDIAIAIYDRATTIKRDPRGESKWSCTSVCSPSGTLWWAEDIKYGSPDKGTLNLTDAKKNGSAFAQLKDEILTFQMPGLDQAMMDEVMVVAVGMIEAMKRKCKGEKMITKMIIKGALGS